MVVRYSSFLPQSKDIHGKAKSKLNVGVNVSMNGFLFL